MFVRNLRPAATLLIFMTLLLGIIYPLAVAGIARLVFPAQAAGSLIVSGGRLTGSRLIGQSFSDPKYFWGRPSATAPQPNNSLASGGSNLGPLNPALVDQVKANVKALQDADPDNHQPIPVELVTASASGLDPDISPAAAAYQMERVARARGIPASDVQALIAAHRQDRIFGYVGEPRVNVLELNLALDLRSDGSAEARSTAPITRITP
jgi:K+-transporting ATPase ATPase C chain